ISGLPTLIPVSEGQAVANINGQLHKGGSITGRIYDSNNQPLPDVTVTVIDPSDTYSDDTTNSNGEYSIDWLPAVNYQVQFNPAEYNAQYGADYLEQWYNNHPDSSNADQVTITEGQTTSAEDVYLQVSSGTVRGVRAENNGTQINISWSAFSGAQSYNIYKTTYSYGSYEKIGSTTSTSYRSFVLSPVKVIFVVPSMVS
ncbi:MAG: carboxypeptidase-like regulatory domain-containing protein, partial [Desulfotomaculaceae bacterium]